MIELLIERVDYDAAESTASFSSTGLASAQRNWHPRVDESCVAHRMACRYRDGAEAVENARQACELSQYQNAFHITVLAAAHAEAGNFEEAFNWIEQAIQMDATSTREAMRDLFQNNEPYRNDPTNSLQ